MNSQIRAILCSLSLAIHSYSLDLHGVVTDHSNNPIPKAKIRLINTTEETQSDTNGNWSFSGPSTSLPRRSQLRNLYIHGNELNFTLVEPTKINADIIESNGQLHSIARGLILEQGPRKIAIPQGNSSIQYLRITANETTLLFILTRINSQYTAISNRTITTNSRQLIASRFLSMGDSIEVYWKDTLVGKVPLNQNDTSSLALRIDTSANWNRHLSYSYFQDPRDGKIYRTRRIGSQVWMAQNLNYWGAGGCYEETPVYKSNCLRFGRMYTWKGIGGQASSDVPSGIQGICPPGWHIPSRREWLKLTDTTIDRSLAGSVLKSSSPNWNWNPGTDDSGFTVLPGGLANQDGRFFKLTLQAHFWTTTAASAQTAIMFSFNEASGVEDSEGTILAAVYVRCIENP